MKKFATLGILVFAVLLVGMFADNPHTPRAPIVVAEQTIVGRFGSSPSVPLFTPASDGTFRLSVYVSSASCSFSSGTPTQVGVTWNDGIDNRIKYSPGPQCNGVGYSMSPLDYTAVIHGSAGQAISFSVVAYDSTDAFSYYLVLEQL